MATSKLAPVRSFECPNCHRRFKTGQGRSGHMRFTHGVETEGRPATDAAVQVRLARHDELEQLASEVSSARQLLDQQLELLRAEVSSARQQLGQQLEQEALQVSQKLVDKHPEVFEQVIQVYAERFKAMMRPGFQRLDERIQLLELQAHQHGGDAIIEIVR